MVHFGYTSTRYKSDIVHQKTTCKNSKDSTFDKPCNGAHEAVSGFRIFDTTVAYCPTLPYVTLAFPKYSASSQKVRGPDQYSMLEHNISMYNRRGR